MISPAALQIIEGSVPWKVIQFLDANPDEQLDIELVSAKYDCPRSQVHTLLSGAVQAGALARSTCRDTGEVIYSKARRALSITERCLEAYRTSADIDQACRLVGVHKLTMFKILKINGVMLIEDRLRLGTQASRFGASAEQEFQRLVPEARSMNSVVNSNQGFDFDVNGWRVDVKACSPIKAPAARKSSWQVRLAKGGATPAHVDFFCLFLAERSEKAIQDSPYRAYLLPVEFVLGRTYLCKTDGCPSALDALEVAPEQLAPFFATNSRTEAHEKL